VIVDADCDAYTTDPSKRKKSPLSLRMETVLEAAVEVTIGRRGVSWRR
jgi:hypothetical protein